MHLSNKVFTKKEIEEMKAYQNDEMAKELPDEYKKHLNKFNCQDASEMRSRLSKT